MKRRLVVAALVVLWAIGGVILWVASSSDEPKEAQDREQRQIETKVKSPIVIGGVIKDTLHITGKLSAKFLTLETAMARRPLPAALPIVIAIPGQAFFIGVTRDAYHHVLNYDLEFIIPEEHWDALEVEARTDAGGIVPTIITNMHDGTESLVIVTSNILKPASIRLGIRGRVVPVEEIARRWTIGRGKQM